MRIPNPGEAGFSLDAFVSKMLRVGIKALGNFGGNMSPFGFLSNRFPTADISWINTVGGWITQGFQAVKTFITDGFISPAVIEAAPIVPIQVFPMTAADRVVIAGDFVGRTASGQEVTRRVTYMSALENDSLADLMGEQTWQLIRKIAGTNPQAAEEIIDKFFEAHWLGRIY